MALGEGRQPVERVRQILATVSYGDSELVLPDLERPPRGLVVGLQDLVELDGRRDGGVGEPAAIRKRIRFAVAGRDLHERLPEEGLAAQDRA